MSQHPGFDVARLIADAGGPKVVASTCKVSRSTPYNWIRRKNIHVTDLAKIKLRFPHLDLNSYVRLVDEQR